MRAVMQRVSFARVVVADEVVGEIAQGLLVFLGIGKKDDIQQAQALDQKIVSMRLFSDVAHKMNLSLKEVAGSCLVVSQFTLFADISHGRRPFFGEAQEPEAARVLCDYFVNYVKEQGVMVASGRFGAMMQVSLCNDGPVTIYLDTDEF